MSENEKKVDEAWKEKAAQEREQGAEKSPEAGPRARGRLPAPSLGALVSSLAVQALIGLGEIDNPVTRKKEADLEQAKFTIDTLQMLSEKTKGNLTPEEKQQLDGILYDLRMRYVQAAG